jgi:hypothetical protein
MKKGILLIGALVCAASFAANNVVVAPSNNEDIYFGAPVGAIARVQTASLISQINISKGSCAVETPLTRFMDRQKVVTEIHIVSSLMGQSVTQDCVVHVDNSNGGFNIHITWL